MLRDFQHEAIPTAWCLRLQKAWGSSRGVAFRRWTGGFSVAQAGRNPAGSIDDDWTWPLSFFVICPSWALPLLPILEKKSVYKLLLEEWTSNSSRNSLVVPLFTTNTYLVLPPTWLTGFLPCTVDYTITFQLLILDGHGSHLTSQFDQLCAENNIVPLCMPAHSSYLL